MGLRVPVQAGFSGEGEPKLDLKELSFHLKRVYSAFETTC